jgi:hypothetical protein
MSKESGSINQSTNRAPNEKLDDDREYETTGLNPPGEKPFRLYGLLGSLLAVIVFIALAAVILDRVLIQ